ncbi:lycopene cyclase domain-containing protein [Agromyces rhizosphaerae]|uniref:lycopene cyclase domain-containing protein n=1 Tax=Agromyces rhizosphaerae TaxID=88374 RepID=UPI002492CCA0|nr:lycopene cyclase domain-containing protein [Agromyces rhizosphaerae]
MGLAYLAALVLSLAAMCAIDARFRLVFWDSPGRAAAVIGIGVAAFLVWDLAGIALGVFFRGETEFMTGILLAPELPLEEVLFLTFLCYLTLVLVLGTRRVLDRERSAS